jgi:ribonuclease R
VQHLLHLHEAYRALLKQRARRGAVDFDTTETQIVCDDAGRIEKIVPRVRTEAHRLIEEAMLAANVCAADFIEQGGHASLYRVHEGPTPEKRVTLQNYLRALGIGLSVSDDPRPAEMQSVAEATRERPDAAQIHQMLLRSMQQAVYTPTNSGHFGLAFDAYTHFTSPIRRYPDLLVHRVIKALLSGKTYRLVPSALRMPPQPRRSLASKATPQQVRATDKQSLAWQAAGLHTSASERRADEASRDVEAWLKCRFMRDRLGEEFQGTVSSVVGFGLFITLDELHVEGLVHVTELGGEYFRFDELRQELRGDRSGMRYGVGTRVRVQVSRVDLDGRRIDFRMVREPASPWEGGKSKSAALDLQETGSSVELLGAALAQDRVVKAKAVKARQTRAGGAATRNSGDRRSVGKSKTPQGAKRGRR